MTRSDEGLAGRGAVAWVVGGTGVVGLSGLLILAVTATVLGAADYAAFGVFWSAVFFVVAVLFGAQQESTRAVANASTTTGSTSLLLFGGLVALTAGVVILATSPWWVPASLGDGHQGLAIAVAAGGAGYAVTGVIAGALAGSERWRSYTAMLLVEGVSRALAVVVVLTFAASVQPLAWAVVVAYPITVLIVVVPHLRATSGSLRVEEPMSVLARNAAKTMVAAASVAALVNGFPLLMSSFSRDASAETVGAMTLAVMLTRAPLLVPLMALQSMLITMFSHKDRSLWKLLSRLMGTCLVLAAVLAAVAAAVGPQILRMAFGEEFVLEGHVLALLVLSSGMIGALCMTSPALVARSQQTSNVVGWVAATLISVAALAFAPVELELRAPLALLIGPLCGLMLHIVALRRVRQHA